MYVCTCFHIGDNDKEKVIQTMDNIALALIACIGNKNNLLYKCIILVEYETLTLVEQKIWIYIVRIGSRYM